MTAPQSSVLDHTGATSTPELARQSQHQISGFSSFEVRFRRRTSCCNLNPRVSDGILIMTTGQESNSRPHTCRKTQSDPLSSRSTREGRLERRVRKVPAPGVFATPVKGTVLFTEFYSCRDWIDWCPRPRRSGKKFKVSGTGPYGIPIPTCTSELSVQGFGQGPTAFTGADMNSVREPIAQKTSTERPSQPQRPPGLMHELFLIGTTHQP